MDVVLETYDELRRAIDRIICALPHQMTEAVRNLEEKISAMDNAILSLGRMKDE